MYLNTEIVLARNLQSVHSFRSRPVVIKSLLKSNLLLGHKMYSPSLAFSFPQDWYTVLEHYHRMNATISDLIMGNTYLFRAFTENKCGISEQATATKTSATILKTGEAKFYAVCIWCDGSGTYDNAEH